MDNYEDIINLPHPVSKKHPQMSMMQRAAQFAPFAALTGYDAAINEAAMKNGEPESHQSDEDIASFISEMQKVKSAN